MMEAKNSQQYLEKRLDTEEITEIETLPQLEFEKLVAMGATTSASEQTTFNMLREYISLPARVYASIAFCFLVDLDIFI